VPAADAGEAAAQRYAEFFAVQIRNPNTKHAPRSLRLHSGVISVVDATKCGGT